MDIFPPAKQRPALLKLAAVMDSRVAALRRDECGDWAIFGKYGHVYAVPEGLQLVVGTAIESCDSQNPRYYSKRQWNSDKNKLGFCRLTQDGDGDGCLILGRMPTATEAVTIRTVLGIPKRRHLSQQQLAAMAIHSFKKAPALEGGFSPK